MQVRTVWFNVTQIDRPRSRPERARQGAATIIKIGTPQQSVFEQFAIVIELDSDGDGIRDIDDSCTMVPNPDQRDGDGDGFGTLCDGDFNNDCNTNAVDLGIFRTRFFSSDAAADFNGDNIVNAVDLGYFKTLFFQPPGSSGLIPDQCN